MVVERFPPEMKEVSVTPQATTISISNHSTKTFEKYSKTLIHFHRSGSSPPQYIYLDLHGTVRNPSFINVGHLIVYDVKETISNVDPSVYDTAFVIENGQMEMQTDLSLNKHRLRGSVYYINGILNTKNRNIFLLNGCEEIIFPFNTRILTIKVLNCNKILLGGKYPLISLKIYHTVISDQSIRRQSSIYRLTKANKLQILNINKLIMSGCISVELESVVQDEQL